MEEAAVLHIYPNFYLILVDTPLNPSMDSFKVNETLVQNPLSSVYCLKL